MDELSLYEQILGVAKPWFVEQVEFDRTSQTVVVHVGIDRHDGLFCPTCGKPSPGYDSRERRWRHLDTCQYKTLVSAKVPRVQCADHGCLTISVPWAEERSRFTYLFENEVIDRLQSASISAVCQQMRMSWNAADGIMQRAVTRGRSRMRKRFPKHLCVDEISIRKGHLYLTIISEPGGRVIAIEEGRSKDSLRAFYDTVSRKQKQALRTISMDMSPTYIPITLEKIPDARDKICFDHFHVTKLINEALDRVRRQETRTLHRVLKDRELSGKRYHWLYNADSLNPGQRAELSELRAIALRTGRAWLLKEYARELWHYVSRTWAEKAWLKWYGKAIRSRLPPMQGVARTIKKYLWGIVNAIVTGSTNAIAESINSKIKRLKVKCCGFRNHERFKTAIMFHCGGLSLKH